MNRRHFLYASSATATLSFMPGVLRLFCRCPLWILVLVIIGVPTAVSRAQTVKIRLVDGKTGQPISGVCINVWVGQRHKWAWVIPTDKDGLAQLQLTNGGKADTSHRWSRCGSFGVIDPVLPYSSDLRINTGYVLCQYRKADHSWLAIEDFSMEQVLRRGLVSKNTCGKATASPEPGEVTIFVRPLTWWDKLKE